MRAEYLHEGDQIKYAARGHCGGGASRKFSHRIPIVPLFPLFVLHTNGKITLNKMNYNGDVMMKSANKKME